MMRDKGKENSSQSSVDSGQWAVVSGQWAVDSGQWTVGNMQWTVVRCQCLVNLKVHKAFCQFHQYIHKNV